MPHMDRETDKTLRPLLFSIAYRMLGGVGDAEDLVQETLLKVHAAERRGVAIRSRKAYACTIVTRLAIDRLRSSRTTRETYVGEWLPEPIVADPRADPEQHAELAESLSLALLVVLEHLNPTERAVFLLHDVFEFPFTDVADIVGKTPANTRQIAVRARRAVAARRPRFEPSRRVKWELATRFFAAVSDGDTNALVELLAADATMYGDGGGKVPVRLRPTTGAPRVAAFLVNLARRGRVDGITAELRSVNGQPGAVLAGADGDVSAVMALDVHDGAINAIRVVVNPDKLRHLHS